MVRSLRLSCLFLLAFVLPACAGEEQGLSTSREVATTIDKDEFGVYFDNWLWYVKKEGTEGKDKAQLVKRVCNNFSDPLDNRETACSAEDDYIASVSYDRFQKTFVRYVNDPQRQLAPSRRGALLSYLEEDFYGWLENDQWTVDLRRKTRFGNNNQAALEAADGKALALAAMLPQVFSLAAHEENLASREEAENHTTPGTEDPQD